MVERKTDKTCARCWKRKPCKCGRPPKFSEEIIGKLLQAFAIDANVKQACAYAEIHPDTYYEWVKKHPELSDRIEVMREKLPLKAKENIARIIHGGSIDDSWQLLGKRDKDYTEKVQVEHSGEILQRPEDGIYPEDKEAYEDYLRKRRENRHRRADEEEKKKSEQPKTYV